MKTFTIRIDPRRLRLLEMNAHFMRHEMFQRLVENIREDGDLTSVPFCAILGYYTAEDEIPLDEEGNPVYEVLSGNHRVKAAIAAGLTEIEVKVTHDPLTRQERLAIQLSHNAIFGEDDPAILKQLYEQIDDVNLRLYSGLDDKTLALLQEVNVSSLSEANLDFQVITFTFLPDEVEAVKKVWAEVEKLVQGDEVWLARWGEYDGFLDMLEAASSSYGVKNVATTLMVVLEVVSRHLDDLVEGWCGPDGSVLHNGWVPLSTVLGAGKMPAKGAAVIKRALEVMVSRGEVESSSRWEALVRWADGYLQGGMEG